ncbi:Ca2+-transporting ATPase [Massilia sp. UYP11]|uniref:cation-translocating P-type ATPase n=1 Tax=Massilia sp. UYP11 TaxID=1756385 RepID=UPI003D214C95
MVATQATPVRQGLSSAEAERRLAASGPNTLPDQARRGWPAILADTAREPMFLLLIGAALLYLALGEPRESVFLLAMVVAMLGMTLYQEGRTERALQSLRDLSAPLANVVRDGRHLRIPAAALVPGDLIVLAAGDRVPADAELLEATGIMVDESLLTGESAPVFKRARSSDDAPPVPGEERDSRVFAGTLVVQGDGLAEVRATGASSELGRIGSALAHIDPPASSLQRETRILVHRLALLGLAVSVLLVLLLGMRDCDWLQALLAGVALSMSMLPEEFPVILTIFPALGAWRLARRQVLTRRLAAIEILGTTTVLCVDKTGTLTENRMDLRLLWHDGAAFEVDAGVPPPAHRALLWQAVLASRAPTTDPLEQALQRVAARLPEAGPAVLGQWVPEREYGLSDTRAATIHIRRGAEGAQAFAKGAPETIAALCRNGGATDALRAAAALASEGLRVLAVAATGRIDPPWPDDPGELHFRLAGLLAFSDPLRADIPAAVAQCRSAGVRVLMVTGDHPATAQAIARQAGLSAGATLTGSEIARLAAGELASRLEGVGVCARTSPRQKLAIVRALQQGGAVVTMTGAGVNDAPALRAADVGVAMGKRGTDVAREAAGLTLLDDRFSSLVQALHAGRRIDDNMRKSMRYVSAVHVPIAMLALLPPLAGWPILLHPMHIAFMELVISPACSLAFESEPEDPDLMRRPPRPRNEPLLGRKAFMSALASGLWAAALLAGAYGLALAVLSEPQARSVAFCGLTLCNLALLLLYRHPPGSRGAALPGNRLLLAVILTTLCMLALALYFPPLGSLFRMAPAPAAWMGFAVLLPVIMAVGVQLARRAPWKAPARV